MSGRSLSSQSSVDVAIQVVEGRLARQTCETIWRSVCVVDELIIDNESP